MVRRAGRVCHVDGKRKRDNRGVEEESVTGGQLVRRTGGQLVRRTGGQADRRTVGPGRTCTELPFLADEFSMEAASGQVLVGWEAISPTVSASARPCPPPSASYETPQHSAPAPTIRLSGCPPIRLSAFSPGFW